MPLYRELSAVAQEACAGKSARESLAQAPAAHGDVPERFARLIDRAARCHASAGKPQPA